MTSISLQLQIPKIMFQKMQDSGLLINYFWMCADIETYDVDKQLNKVTVTGNVTNEEVIKVLHKIGKQASNWDQQSSC